MAASPARKVLITGGSRSGKSTLAIQWASKYPRRLFIATAIDHDEEMRDRIERHQLARGPEWQIIEESSFLSRVVRNHGSRFDAIVIDCLTLWTSHWLLSGSDEPDFQREAAAFCELLPTISASVFIVTNEVGAGIVPDNEQARRFRDWAGSVNQQVAAAVSEAWIMVCGIPLQIKPASPGQKA